MQRKLRLKLNNIYKIVNRAIIVFSIALVATSCQLGRVSGEAKPLNKKQIFALKKAIDYHDAPQFTGKGVADFLTDDAHRFLIENNELLIVVYGNSYSGPYCSIRRMKSGESIRRVAILFMEENFVNNIVTLISYIKDNETLTHESTEFGGEPFPIDVLPNEFLNEITQPGTVLVFGGLL